MRLNSSAAARRVPARSRERQVPSTSRWRREPHVRRHLRPRGAARAPVPAQHEPRPPLTPGSRGVSFLGANRHRPPVGLGVRLDGVRSRTQTLSAGEIRLQRSTDNGATFEPARMRSGRRRCGLARRLLRRAGRRRVRQHGGGRILERWHLVADQGLDQQRRRLDGRPASSTSPRRRRVRRASRRLASRSPSTDTKRPHVYRAGSTTAARWARAGRSSPSATRPPTRRSHAHAVAHAGTARDRRRVLGLAARPAATSAARRARVSAWLDIGRDGLVDVDTTIGSHASTSSSRDQRVRRPRSYASSTRRLVDRWTAAGQSSLVPGS